MAETLANTANLSTAASGGNPLVNLQNRWASLPQKNKIALLAGIPMVLAVVVSLFLWANQTQYRVLFSGINDKDGGAITEALTQMKVPYEFNSSGTAILVPADKVYDTRLALASQGLPKGSTMGFEAMDNQKLGITQFQEQINYQRGLEGELTRSIQSISAVQHARVHLAIPKPSIFIREKQSPSASVILTLHGGRRLNESQIQGIIHLVSSSVPGMLPEHVSIVDQSGQLLTERPDDGLGMNPNQLAYQTQVENSLNNRIINILSPVFGENNVRATVTANMDFSLAERTDEIFKPNGDPNNASIRSQQLSESRDGSSTNPSGVPGTLSNQPPGVNTAPIGQNAGANNNGGNNAAQENSRRDTTVNYELDKSVQYKKEQMGRIQRLTAAVVVNLKQVPAEDGSIKEVPLTEQEMTQLDALVKKAIGFDEQRGDSIHIVNQAFSKTKEEPMPVWANPDVMDLAKSVGLPLGIALAAAAAIFGLIKPMLQVPEFKKPTTAIAVAAAPSDLELLDQLQKEGALPEVGLSRQERLERLRQLAKDHPQVIANIVKSWVNNEAAGT